MSATALRERHCQPCAGGTAPLEPERAGALLEQLHGDWTLSADGREISRTCEFGNYYQTMAFVNALAWIAHNEDHHPDIEVSYKRCRVRYSTHMIGGLSDNDFICAAKIDALLPPAA
jgi:4a-hydroxytetrahydrobiopterin dehydratase